MYSLCYIIKSIFVGYIAGLVISIPLGPSAIESINRTLSQSFKQGFIVSLGAVSADVTYLVLVNCGLFKLLTLSKNTESLFWILCGIVMIIIGYNSIFKNNSNNCKNSYKKYSSFLTGYIITLCNPMTPTLWLTLSATILTRWYTKGLFLYTLSILSMIIGMISWFVLLNTLALKGLKVNTSNHSGKILIIIKWGIVLIGFVFLYLGIHKFIA